MKRTKKEFFDWFVGDAGKGYEYFIIGYNPITEHILYLAENDWWGARGFFCHSRPYRTRSLEKATKELKLTKIRKRCGHITDIQILRVMTKAELI